VAPTAGVGGFVRRGEDSGPKVPDHNGVHQGQQTGAHRSGSNAGSIATHNINISRQTLAASARVKLPTTRLEYSQSKVTANPTGVPTDGAKQYTSGHILTPAPRSIQHTRMDHPQWQTGVTDGFETDIDGLDDTSTSSFNISSSPRKSSNALYASTFATSNNLQSTSPTKFETLPPVKHEKGPFLEDEYGYEEEEDGTYSDESVEADPLLFRPGEEEAFLKFQEELRTKGLPETLGDMGESLKQEISAARNFTRPSSNPQPFSRARLDTLTNANERALLRSADSDARPQKQADLTSGNGSVPPRSTQIREPARQSELSPKKPDYKNTEKAKPTHQEIRAPQSQPVRTASPYADTDFSSRGLPEHPRKVQGATHQANDWRAENKVQEPRSAPHADERIDFDREQPIMSQKRPLGLDYTEEELAQMSYDQLKSESFDHNPKPIPSVLPKELKSEPLGTQLEHLCNLPDISEEDQFSKQQDFFSSLSIDKYEECGDIILEKFGEILGKFKKARQDKRKIAREFEDEVSQREHLVSLGAEAIDKDMARLRRAGEDVIKGNIS
jgi:hypothetical protein